MLGHALLTLTSLFVSPQETANQSLHESHFALIFLTFPEINKAALNWPYYAQITFLH